MIKVGVIGATGYAGSELIRILYNHPDVEIVSCSSQSYVGKKYKDVYQNFRQLTDIICEEENIQKLSNQCDVIFIALPHGIASGLVTKEILHKTKIIDLGADFRFKDTEVYEQWYGVVHQGKGIRAVYGLSEIKREEIKDARLIANPGCYTTCSILSLAPPIKEKIIDLTSVVIDAKSGVTGAGRSLSQDVLYSEVNETVKAYKIGTHRHTPEIEEQLTSIAKEKITLSFTPHLIPMNRGILTTIYAKLNKEVGYEEIKEIYDDFYRGEYFIRLTKEGIFPETRWIKGSNFFDVGFAIDERTNRLVIVGALDNLVKGAAGQAVQNMNILFDRKENAGLHNAPIFPA